MFVQWRKQYLDNEKRNLQKKKKLFGKKKKLNTSFKKAIYIIWIQFTNTLKVVVNKKYLVL